MRHPVTALAILALAASISACGGQKQEEPADTTATETPATPSATVAATNEPPAAFFQCRSCHSVEPGKNGIGPTLHGIVGTKAGEVPGFAFSPALKQSGITWDRATLEQWLAGPTKMVPGTRMVIAVPDPVKRKEIIDYLHTLN
jgi:cytochrome c